MRSHLVALHICLLLVEGEEQSAHAQTPANSGIEARFLESMLNTRNNCACILCAVIDEATSGPALTLLGSQLLDQGKLSDATIVFKRVAMLFPSVPLVDILWLELPAVSSE